MTSAPTAARTLAKRFNPRPPVIRRVGDSWFIESETDKSEAEHRVDLLAGRLYCSCIGFASWRHCKHQTLVRSVMTTDERAIVTTTERLEDNTALPDVWRSPQDLQRRLADMIQERSLVQQFMQTVMVRSRDGEADGDYGIIPGTDKPTLFKAGAEKLCELYGYAPTIADLREIADYETGHYRVVCTIALVHKGSGVKVGEGVGECSTRESKYLYRWVFANDVPPELDKSKLKQKTVGSRRDPNTKYTMYRLENDDLFSLWNTVLKMAKKRALVDATLSTTRSSQIFSQTKEHLDEYVEAEYSVGSEPEERQAAKAPAAPKPAASSDTAALADLRNRLLKVLSETATWDSESRLKSFTFLHQQWPDAFAAPASGKKPDVTKLEAEQIKHVISLLQPDHDHDPAYTSDDRLICRSCGCPLPESPAAGAQQTTFE